MSVFVAPVRRPIVSTFGNRLHSTTLQTLQRRIVEGLLHHQAHLPLLPRLRPPAPPPLQPPRPHQTMLASLLQHQARLPQVTAEANDPGNELLATSPLPIIFFGCDVIFSSTAKMKQTSLQTHGFGGVAHES